MLKPGLPHPTIKVLNHTGSQELGRCLWKTGEKNTTIEIQRRIVAHEHTLRRVVAHELCHHEEFLDYWATRVPEGGLSRRGLNVFKLHMRLEGSHGQVWKAIAARFNAKYGADFVTERSDEDYVQDAPKKEFFVLMRRWGNDIIFQWATRLGPAAQKKLEKYWKNSPEFKLVKSQDPLLLGGARIGEDSYSRSSDKNRETLQKLWDSAPDLKSTFAPAVSPSVTTASAKAPRKHAIAMVELPEEARQQVLAAGQSIPDEDLGADGRERNPHITLKYGIQEDIEGLTAALKNFKSFKITLGKLHVFIPTEASGYQSPVVAEAEAPELTQLHSTINQKFSAREDDFEYKPHVTLAFVKNDVAGKYERSKAVEDVTFEVKAVTLSLRDRTTKEIPLAEATEPKAKEASTFKEVWDILDSLQEGEQKQYHNVLLQKKDGRWWVSQFDPATGNAGGVQFSRSPGAAARKVGPLLKKNASFDARALDTFLKKWKLPTQQIRINAVAPTEYANWDEAEEFLTRPRHSNSPRDDQGNPEDSEIYPYLQAIRKKRPFPPVLVTRDDNGRLEILDGHHRVTASRMEGETSILAVILTEEQVMNQKLFQDYYTSMGGVHHKRGAGDNVIEYSVSPLTPNKNFVVAAFSKVSKTDLFEVASRHPGANNLPIPDGYTLENMVGFAAAIYQSEAKSYKVGFVEVLPDFKRRGIATRLYNEVEKQTGVKLEPSPMVTEEGQAFWKSRKGFKFAEFNQAEGQQFIDKFRAIGVEVELVGSVAKKTKGRDLDLLVKTPMSTEELIEKAEQLGLQHVGNTNISPDEAADITTPQRPFYQGWSVVQHFKSPWGPIDLWETDEAFKQTLQASHKTPPLSDTQYENSENAGEEKGSYTEVPERVKDTREQIPLETLSPDLFKEGAKYQDAPQRVELPTGFYATYEKHPMDNQDTNTWKIFNPKGIQAGEIALYFYEDSVSPYPSVGYISLKPEFLGKGIGRAIVREIAKVYGGLTSDPQGQTSDMAVSMWEALGAEKVPTDKNSKGFMWQIKASALRYLHNDPMEDELGEYQEAAYALAKNEGISVLSDKDPFVFVLDGQTLVGCLFITTQPVAFSFDIVVDRAHQNQGIGTRLVEMAEQEYKEVREAYDDFDMQLDVVNPKMKRLLESKGYHVVEDQGDRWMMSKHAATEDLEDVLWEVCQAVRDRLIPDRDAQEGDCQPVSEAVVEELHRRGYTDAQSMMGTFEGHPHEWVVVGDYYVDATHDQFAAYADEGQEDVYIDNPIVIRKQAKGLIVGQAYLLHFNIEPGTVIPPTRADAKKPFHARHYLGWAEVAATRIEEHRSGNTSARLMKHLHDQGITFEVARIWDGVDREFERKLKNQGGLSRHCPICKRLGIDRDSLRKKLKEVEPETPTAGPDFVEENGDKKTSAIRDNRWLLMYFPGEPVQIKKDDGDHHKNWAEKIGWEGYLKETEVFRRGFVLVDNTRKELAIACYGGQEASFAPDAVVEKFKQQFPGYSVRDIELTNLDNTMKLRYGAAEKGLYTLLQNIKPELASDAQLAYDDWAGNDGRGLCTTLAEGMAYTINKELGHENPYNITQEEAELKGRASDINDEGSHHFWVYVEKGAERYGVDIPYGLYERADERERMFKIPGVKLTPAEVHVFPVKGIDDTPWDAIPNYKRAAKTGPLYNFLVGQRSKMALAAQEIYDQWNQSDEGIDDELGGGGICDQISEAIGSLAVGEGAPDGTEITAGGQDGDDHAWSIVYNRQTNEIYGLDVAPGVYETGGGYSWKKIPNVKFGADDVEVFPLQVTLDELDFHEGSAKTAGDSQEQTAKLIAAVNAESEPYKAGPGYGHGEHRLWNKQVQFALTPYDLRDGGSLGAYLTDVKSLETGKGHGSAFMRRLCELADQYRVSLQGFASAMGDEGPDDEGLKEWYKKFGFAFDGGRMVRRPKGADKTAGPLTKALIPTALALGLGGSPNMHEKEIKQPPPIVQKAPKEQAMDRLVYAISRAEGAKPWRNNPGNIADNQGKIRSFPTFEEGSKALRSMLDRIADGNHPHIDPDMPLREAGLIYADGDPNWAKNVASILRISPETPFGDVIRGNYKSTPKPPKKGAEKLNDVHRDVLEHLKGGTPLYRFPGGFWIVDTVEGKSPTSGAPLNAQGETLWWCGTQTVRAMEKRGLIQRTNKWPEEWRDERVITDKGRAALQTGKIGAEVISFLISPGGEIHRQAGWGMHDQIANRLGSNGAWRLVAAGWVRGSSNSLEVNIFLCDLAVAGKQAVKYLETSSFQRAALEIQRVEDFSSEEWVEQGDLPRAVLNKIGLTPAEAVHYIEQYCTKNLPPKTGVGPHETHLRGYKPGPPQPLEESLATLDPQERAFRKQWLLKTLNRHGIKLEDMLAPHGVYGWSPSASGPNDIYPEWDRGGWQDHVLENIVNHKQGKTAGKTALNPAVALPGQAFYLWAYTDDMGLKLHKPGPLESGLHSDWFQEMGWPYVGHMSDRYDRGIARVANNQVKISFSNSNAVRHEDEIISEFVRDFPGSELFVTGKGKVAATNQYVENDEAPENSDFYYRGTSLSEIVKIFQGGELGADWGLDFVYSSEFADGYAGGGAGAVMVADRKRTKEGRWLLPDPQDIVALLEPHTGRILWEKSKGWYDKELEARVKGHKTASEDLRPVIEGARKAAIGPGKAAGGDCTPISQAVQEALKDRYPDARIVDGAFYKDKEANEGWHHTWVEIPAQRMFIDATHDQFGGEPILIGSVVDPYFQDHYEEDKEDSRWKTAAEVENFPEGAIPMRLVRNVQYAFFLNPDGSSVGGYGLQHEDIVHKLTGKDSMNQIHDFCASTGAIRIAGHRSYLGFEGYTEPTTAQWRELARFIQDAQDFSWDFGIDGKHLSGSGRTVGDLRRSLAPVEVGKTGASMNQVAQKIVADKELFDTIRTYTAETDWFSDHPELNNKLVGYLKQITPFRKTLYRGESFYSRYDRDANGFTSWSLNRDTADYFRRESRGVLRQTVGPIQAISLAALIDAFYHAGGTEYLYDNQQEWLVLNGCKTKIVQDAPGWDDWMLREEKQRGKPQQASKTAEKNKLDLSTPPSWFGPAEHNVMKQVWRPEQMKMLYHGTSDIYREAIQKKGFPAGTYVTLDYDTAVSEAYHTCYQDVDNKRGVGGQPIIVKLDPKKIKSTFRTDPEYLGGAEPGQDYKFDEDVYSFISNGRISPTAITNIHSSGDYKPWPGAKNPGAKPKEATRDADKDPRNSTHSYLVANRWTHRTQDDYEIYRDPSTEHTVLVYPTGSWTHFDERGNEIVSGSNWTSLRHHAIDNFSRRASAGTKTAFRIEVPKGARDHFWEEPPAGNWEFWAYKKRPNVLPGEKIVFTFGGAPVARAVVHHVEDPGRSKCENTGKYEKHFKVFWEPQTFVRLDGKVR